MTSKNSLHGDHLGSTSLTTDSNGAVVSECRYTPYGQERGCIGTKPSDFGYTGQRNEASFGLMDYNARYYSPRLGRFVSPDTIIANPLDSNSYNRYAYVNNNPINHTDPTGHICLECVGDLILGAMVQYTDNNLQGAGFISVSTPRQRLEALNVANEHNLHYQLGRMVGSVASMAQGVAEMSAGAAQIGGGTAGGLVTCAETLGAGCAAGTSVAVTGAMEAVHGAGVTASGVGGFAESVGNILNIKGKGGGGSGGSKSPLWTPHGYKHFASENQTWKSIIKSTEKGPAKYKFGTDIETLERSVWDNGIPVTNGKTWKVQQFDNVIGASGGQESRWIRVEYSGNTIHGHPITEWEYQNLIK